MPDTADLRLNVGTTVSIAFLLMQFQHQGRVVLHILDEVIVIFPADNRYQVVLFPFQRHDQPVGVGRIFFKIEFLAIEKIVFFIPSHFQNGAVQIPRQFKKR